MPPSRIFGLILTVIGILAFICLLTPADGIHIDLRWPTLSDMLLIGDTASTDTVAEEEAQAKPAATPQVPDNILDTVTDTRFWLRSFYESLPTASQRAIRVVHYGDSQLEEDRMTCDLRRDLQTRFGGGGVGMVPLHQSIPTQTMSHSTYINDRRQTIKQGPQRFLIYGPKNMRRTDRNYGPMGQNAYLDNAAVEGSESLEVRLATYTKNNTPECYFTRLRLLASEGVHVSANGQTIGTDSMITFPDSTHAANLRFSGKGFVYGISLETPTGVIVDNMAMRGCSGTIFKGIDKAQLQHYFQSTNTRLIILQFGGNSVNASEASVRHYAEIMRDQIHYLKECAPEAAFLFIGPSDMLTTKGGQKITIPGVPLLDKLLLRMCQEERIGYWSLYQAMGGEGSMKRWQEQHLAGGDGIHFTHDGATKAGKMLADYIEQGRQMVLSK